MRLPPYLVALVAAVAFINIVFWSARESTPLINRQVQDRVVIAAPMLLILYGGDRFLAANLETMRLAATGTHLSGEADVAYLVRAQYVVAQLNACHEDNYYMANGLLAWGGAVSEANEVLRAAVRCRTWDFVPPFFYGVNLAFFQRDIPEAQRMLEIGAGRSPANAAGLRNLAVLLQANSFSDEKMALNYLMQQRDSARDPKLRGMLDMRVVRLRGLVALREAQRKFEAENGALVNLSQLVEAGFLPVLPSDPLRLGYELRDGVIQLKKIKIAGLEGRP